LADHHRRPLRVIGFGADEGDIDRRLLGEMLRLGQMQCPQLDRERLLAIVMRDAQAVLFHFFDMRRPHVDKGHVLACPHHVRAGIAADRSDPNDRDSLTLHCSPVIPCGST
jgi:hypothetical protein